MKFTFDGANLPKDPEEAAKEIAEKIRAALEVLNRRSLPEIFIDFFALHLPEVCEAAVFGWPRPVFDKGAGLFIGKPKR